MPLSVPYASADTVMIEPLPGTERRRARSGAGVAALAVVALMLAATAPVPGSAQIVGADVETPIDPMPDPMLESRIADFIADTERSGEPGRYIVIFDPDQDDHQDRGDGDRRLRPLPNLSPTSAASRRQAIARVGKRLAQRLGIEGTSSARSYAFVPAMAMTLDRAALLQLADDPAVLRVEPDILVEPTLEESIPYVEGDYVRDHGYTGAGQAVAILDTGVDKTHPFLAGRVISEACYSTNGSGSSSVCPGGASSSTAEGSGVNCPLAIAGCDHGTHVAGIAAGSGGPSSAPDGVAPGADIIAIQVFSRFDTGCASRPAPCAKSWFSDVLAGLDRIYALRDTFSIAAANLSLGSGQYGSHCDADFSYLKATIDDLMSAGIATVIASGNNGWDGSVSTPGCISSAITVGSTPDTDNSISSFSNHAAMVDLLAPGGDITSSVPGGGYAAWWGTSMATPHVAGAWALLKSVAPAATVTRLKKAFTDTGRMISRGGVAKPRIDLQAAFDDLGVLSPVNTLFADATILEGTFGTANGTTVGAYGESGEPDHHNISLPLTSIWFRWTSPVDEVATFDTNGSDFDTTLAIYTGTGVGTLTEIVSDDDSGDDSRSLATFVAVAGTTYHIAVDGYDSDQGSVVLNYTALPPPTEVIAARDSFIDQDAKKMHSNEGGNPALWLRAPKLKKGQPTKEQRVLVGFDAGEIQDFLNADGLSWARLVLSIDKAKCKKTGSPVDALPMAAAFTEGIGRTQGVNKKERVEGIGAGVTWNCATDPDVASPLTECATSWGGGLFAPATAAPEVHQKAMTEAEWDVTTDVQAGVSEWMIAAVDAPGVKSCKITYHSREGAIEAGDSALAPKLLLYR